METILLNEILHIPNEMLNDYKVKLYMYNVQEESISIFVRSREEFII